MTSTPPAAARKAFQHLRGVCTLLAERIILGRAYRNGWEAPALMHLASTFSFVGQRGSTPCRAAYLKAIQIGADHIFDPAQPNQYWLMKKAPPVDHDWPNIADNKKN